MTGSVPGGHLPAGHGVRTAGHPPAGNRVRTVTDRLLLLDGHSLAYRAFYALPEENFATTTGLPTNAVYGFTAMLINVLRDEKPTHVAVAFDRREPTFRHQQYD
ncbi:MAG: polymerase, partial [Actinomycetia bacterium]|nr:polymerase [Actinomycetes bacterium]